MAKFIPLKKPGLTPVEILRSTPTVTHERAKNVSVTDIKVGKDDTGHLFYTATTRSVRDDEGKVRRGAPSYKSSVLLYKPEYRYIKVDCTCMFHPYSGSEVSLSLRNAADILRSNGRAPKVNNPSMAVYCCKHLVALLMRLHSMGKIK